MCSLVILVFVICYTSSSFAAAPTFSTPTRSVDILESLIVGGLVTELSASDPDGDSLRYSLQTINPPDADEIFSVAPSGEVTTRTKLDYESQTEYTLVIRAAANNEVAEQTLSINIINVNEAPMFPSGLMGATAENYATAGYTVTVMKAVDPDNTLDTVYSITEGNTPGHFLIGQVSGVITVSPGTRLNKTITSAYALTIEAADKGTPPRTGTTTLVIGVCAGVGVRPMDSVFYISILMAVIFKHVL